MADEQIPAPSTTEPASNATASSATAGSTAPTSATAAAPVDAKPLVDILIRIELAGPAEDGAYEALHQGMLSRDWLTTLTTDDGQNLPLPDVTYSGQTSEALSTVSQTLHDWIVAEIWGDGATVLVTELAGWSMWGDF